MAIMAMAMALVKSNKSLSTSLVFLMFFYPAISFAGTSEFTPKFTLDETFTDNVELTPTDKTASLVSQIGIIIDEKYTAKNASLDLVIDSIYAMYSHDSKINQLYNTGTMDGHLNLWPEGLSLVGSATLSNEAENGVNNSLADIVSGDTVQTLSYSTGLLYQSENSSHTLDIASGYVETVTEDGIGESHGIKNVITSENGPGAKNFFWNLDSKQSQLTDNGQDRDSLITEVKLGLLTSLKLNPFLRYFNEDFSGTAQSGIASNSYGAGLRWKVNQGLYFDMSYNIPTEELDANGDPSENYIDTSVEWKPTSRTTLAASFSQRFYGDSYGLDLTHRNRRLTNNISYTEGVEAFTRDKYVQQSAGFYWCPNGEEITAQDCALTNNQSINLTDSQLFPLSESVLVPDNSFSLNRQLNWTSTLALSRTTFTLNLNGNNRDDLNDNSRNEYRFASLSIERKLNPRSSLTFNSSFTKNDTIFSSAINTDNGQEDEYTQYTLDYTRDINTTFDVVIGMYALTRKSTTELYNYDERRLYFQMTKGF